MHQHEQEKLGSSFGAFWNFFKNMFGAGILVLPYAFASAGLLAGIIIYFFALVVSIISMVLLLRCKEIATKNLNGDTTLITTYPGLAHHALGQKGYWVLATLVVLLELAFCTGWVIVSSHNLAIIFWNDTTKSFLVVICIFPILSLLSFIKYLRQLWFLSFLGFFVYFFGVMGTSYLYIATTPSLHETTPALVHWNTLPSFFGTAMYSLEAILMVLPIQASMKRPDQACFVVSSSAVLYALLAGVFGAVCYTFGLSSCHQGVTDCLPDGALTTIVRLALSMSMIVGYPCLLYPVTEVLEDMFFPSTASSSAWNSETMHLLPISSEQREPGCTPARGQAGRYFLRMMEVAMTCLVAAIFADNFNVFANIVGAILIPLVGFVCPAVLHIKLSGWKNLSTVTLSLDLAFIVLGFVFLGVSTSTL